MKQPACYKSFQTADAARLQETKEIIKPIVSVFNIKVIRNVELSFRGIGNKHHLSSKNKPV